MRLFKDNLAESTVKFDSSVPCGLFRRKRPIISSPSVASKQNRSLPRNYAPKACTMQ